MPVRVAASRAARGRLVLNTVCDALMQDGQSVLHIAAKTGNAETVRFLVLSGADIDDYNEVTTNYIQRRISPSVRLSTTHLKWPQ